MDIQLTLKDRIFLINQYQILKALYPDNSQFYDERIEILEFGYTIFYDEIISLDGDELSQIDCKFVLDILDCYRFIDDYLVATSDEEVRNHPWSYFRGFDGNHETHLLVFARFLIKTQGKFQEQLQYLKKNDNLDSHACHRKKYEKMIETWKTQRFNRDFRKENILAILNT